jgi:hypothetical protein
MEIKAVMENLETILLGLPNVTAVSIGKKNEKDIINVFVTEKIPESQLNKSAVIPKKFGKFEIEVRIERRNSIRYNNEIPENYDENIMPFPPNEILLRMEQLISAAESS